MASASAPSVAAAPSPALALDDSNSATFEEVKRIVNDFGSPAAQAILAIFEQTIPPNMRRTDPVVTFISREAAVVPDAVDKSKNRHFLISLLIQAFGNVVVFGAPECCRPCLDNSKALLDDPEHRRHGLFEHCYRIHAQEGDWEDLLAPLSGDRQLIDICGNCYYEMANPVRCEWLAFPGH